MESLRGRVVVLIFWGNGSDMQGHRIPLAADLIERFRDKPVTFLGISSDGSAAKTRDTIEKEHVTFPNIVDGSERKIERLWNVRANPTFHIIDAQGVIRHKKADVRKLEGLVNELLTRSEMTGETNP
jgi:peroxiredoxin